MKKLESLIIACADDISFLTQMPELIAPYLDGEQTWEECYADIEKEWAYLDE